MSIAKTLHVRAADALDIASSTWAPSYTERGWMEVSVSRATEVEKLREEWGSGTEITPERLAEVHESMTDLVSEIIGQPVVPTEFTAIRTHDNLTAVLGHVDPLSIRQFCVQVILELDEPWELHLLDMAIATQMAEFRVSMDPAKIVFYEGQRMAHGRPAFEGNRAVLVHFYYRPEVFST